MGVINDGHVSGLLPKMEAFAIYYPGYPSSTSRAVESLGGIEGIVKARSSKSNYLELHFRPEDPYSHPAFGELRQSSSLLLRISKKKSIDERDVIQENKQNSLMADKPNVEAAPFGEEGQFVLSESETATVDVDKNLKTNEEASSTKLFADVVARVPQSYCFEGMVDYQHILAVHVDVARRRKRQWSEVETHFEKGGLMDIDQEDLMLLVPPLFTSKDIPENLVLNPSISLSSKGKQVAVVNHQWEMDIEPCLAIDFNIEDILIVWFILPILSVFMYCS